MLAVVPRHAGLADVAPAVTVGRWRIDVAAREARDGGLTRRISRRTLDVLLRLVQADGDVVSRADLMDAAWPDVTVGDESLTQAVAELRRALGTDPAGGSYVETVPKAGYRLAASARTEPSRPAQNGPGCNIEAHLAITEARRLARYRGVLAQSEIEILIREAIAAAPQAAHVQAEYAVQMTLAAMYAGDRQARLTRASEAAVEAVRLRPDQIAPRRALAFVRGVLGDMDGALENFARCLAIDPDDFESHYLGSQICMNRGYFRQAIILGTRASELAPDDYRPAFYAARAALKLGDDERAQEMAALALRRIEAHLAFGPSSHRFLSARAAAAAMLGQCVDDPAVIFQRTETRPLLYDVIALAHLGETDLAAEAFDRLVESGLSHADYVEADPVSDLLARERRFSHALEHLRAA